MMAEGQLRRRQLESVMSAKQQILAALARERSNLHFPHQAISCRVGSNLNALVP
jgi:hypothetical protein